MQQENEQLYRNEENQRRTQEQVASYQTQLSVKESEIEKLDAKLRKAFLLKEELDIEVQSLRKQVATLSLDKQTFAQQKELLSGQTREAEKRIYELTKQRQDGDAKIQQNASFIKDLVAERDKYKESSQAKEEEILELSEQIKEMRTTNTDLKLIEEKVDSFLQDIMLVIEQIKRKLRQQLDDFVHLVVKSNSLASRVNIRQREQGHTYLEALVTEQPAKTVSGAEAYQSMQKVRESVASIGDVAKYNADMLDLFVADAVNIHSDIVKRERQVNHLEDKLGSIHTVDFKAQQDAADLRNQLHNWK